MIATIVIVLFIISVTIVTYPAYGEARTYLGNSAPKEKMTTCRLAAKRTFGETKYCIYKGANGTYEQHSVPSYEICEKQFSCKYRPRKAGKETIEDIMEKLERSLSQ